MDRDAVSDITSRSGIEGPGGGVEEEQLPEEVVINCVGDDMSEGTRHARPVVGDDMSVATGRSMGSFAAIQSVQPYQPITIHPFSLCLAGQGVVSRLYVNQRVRNYYTSCISSLSGLFQKYGLGAGNQHKYQMAVSIHPVFNTATVAYFQNSNWIDPQSRSQESIFPIIGAELIQHMMSDPDYGSSFQQFLEANFLQACSLMMNGMFPQDDEGNINACFTVDVSKRTPDDSNSSVFDKAIDKTARQGAMHEDGPNAKHVALILLTDEPVLGTTLFDPANTETYAQTLTSNKWVLCFDNKKFLHSTPRPFINKGYYFDAYTYERKGPENFKPVGNADEAAASSSEGNQFLERAHKKTAESERQFVRWTFLEGLNGMRCEDVAKEISGVVSVNLKQSKSGAYMIPVPDLGNVCGLMYKPTNRLLPDPVTGSICTFSEFLSREKIQHSLIEQRATFNFPSVTQLVTAMSIKPESARLLCSAGESMSVSGNSTTGMSLGGLRTRKSRTRKTRKTRKMKPKKSRTRKTKTRKHLKK
jgi:hypothetical protein